MKTNGFVQLNYTTDIHPLAVIRDVPLHAKINALLPAQRATIPEKHANAERLSVVSACDLYLSIAEHTKMNDAEITAQHRLQLENFKLALLRAIFLSQGINLTDAENDLSLSRRAQLAVISFFSLTAAAFEGFAAMATFLLVFQSISASAILLPSMALSLLAVFLHYGYEVSEITAHYGMSLFDAKSLLTATYAQQQVLQTVLQHMLLESQSLAKKSSPKTAKQVNELKQLSTFVKQVARDITAKKTAINQLLQPTLTRDFYKNTLAVAAGVFYALGGFFTGIEAATLAVTLTMGAAVVSSFAPIIIAAGIVGAIGFVCPYIFVYSRGASNFVNSIYGIPDDLQQKFSNNQLAIKQTRAHLRLQLDALKPEPVEKPTQQLITDIQQLQQRCTHQQKKLQRHNLAGCLADKRLAHDQQLQTLQAVVSAKQLSKASFSELLQQRDNWRDFQREQDKLLHRTTESQTAVPPARKSAVNFHRYFASAQTPSGCPIVARPKRSSGRATTGDQYNFVLA